MSGLAGRLRERVTIMRSSGARDAIGGDAGETVALGAAWAAIVPHGEGAPAEGEAPSALPRWALTLRPRDLRVGDRIGWGGRGLIVRAVTADPTAPDRIEAIAEEQR